MMKIFEILIYAIVTVVFIAVMVNLFIIPEDDVYNDLAISASKALAEPGKPISLEYSFPKELSLSNITLSNNHNLQAYNKLLFFFKLSESNKTKINITEHIIEGKYLVSANVKSRIYKDNATIVCNPYIAYIQGTEEENYDLNLEYKFLDNYNFFCEIIFGEKLEGEIKATLLNKFENKITPGEYEKNISIDRLPKDVTFDDLIVRVFVFENNNDFNISFSDQIYSIKNEFVDKLKYMETFTFNGSNAKFNLPLKYVGDYFVVYEIASKSLTFSDSKFIGPTTYIAENVFVQQTYDDIAKSCKATDKQYSYYDFDNERCVYYYNCENCYLPSMCKEAWQSKGIVVEENSVNYAEGYAEPKECGMDTFDNSDNQPNDITNTNNNNNPVVSNTKIIWPASNNYVTSCFGYRSNFGRNHDGIDISGKIGDPIYAIADGKVSNISSSWGLVTLDHGSYLSRYIHMDVINVTMGQTIKKGQKIGVIGGRGPAGRNQYASHLHFEILIKGVSQKGNIDDYPEEDIFLQTPEKSGLAVNPLCFYDSKTFNFNNKSPVCNIQGGALKWCSEYSNITIGK